MKIKHLIAYRIGYRKRLFRQTIIFALLSLILLFLACLSLVLGNTNYSLSVIYDSLFNNTGTNATFAIRTLRLPRMLAGLFVGISFGLAGSTFQTMLRNPLASPDIIGVTSGSSVAAVFCLLILRVGGFMVSVTSLIFGLLVAMTIYLLSQGNKFSTGKLILIGIGMQTMLNAIVSYLLLKASQYDIPAAMRWLSGSLNGIRLSSIPLLMVITILFSFIIISLTKQLNILALGDDMALTLGLRTHTVRLLLILCSVVLIGFSTAVTGPIAFVSFLSGPIAQKLVGNGSSNAIHAGLIGAILVLTADLIGQFAFGTKFPVGIITGMIGAPYLLILLVQMNRRGKS